MGTTVRNKTGCDLWGYNEIKNDVKSFSELSKIFLLVLLETSVLRRIRTLYLIFLLCQ